MTYEEFKKIVMEEFPDNMAASHLAKFRSAREHVLLLGNPPLEEILEIERGVLKRTYQAMLERSRELDQDLWTTQAVRLLLPAKPSPLAGILKVDDATKAEAIGAVVKELDEDLAAPAPPLA